MVTTASHTLQDRLDELAKLQTDTLEKPYSIHHRLSLANAYRSLGYPDLAAGDAYKALLLVDECVETGEFHDEALEAATSDYQEQSGSLEEDTDKVIQWAKSCGLKHAYEILIPCLIYCGCLRSAAGFIKRALRAFPEEESLASYRKTLDLKLRSHFTLKNNDIDAINIEDYPDKGFVRRELYPWNQHEPDRFSPEALQFLNEEMERIAHKLEVRVSELPLLGERSSASDNSAFVKQLGVFAKEDISPGEGILTEKSLLTGISRLHDSYCDACSISLSSTDDDPHSATISCDGCDEVFFCSEECHDLAQDNYHPSLCGVNMEQKVSASEAADSLYTLLLVRAMGMAETQDVHPLDLKEVRYIWGDYHGLDLGENCALNSDPFASVPQTLSFSFEANVLRPLHVLEKMDVNIYEQSHRYDTWIFNTLYAKFRGTASAQQGLDGRPEIGAVHPMWCLANHSCDPNVTWEWKGSMRFWAREQLVDYERRVPKRPGLKKGEEVFSHYCDIRLSVQERREWAVGALGGLCVCPRCICEEAQLKD
ncbi:uncharacterized protein N0V89_002053 [Didymosphaeria variabile]|uniref:SET domain-containing protein n=1 Tax=Didymosphaeria variabile TaxID=1932322 RepID=A0A9W8XQZ3_9PLEO|nr:uncharacterized protein N0V89_002053 [Didymosphaeria variabile]KAJ4357477.1 hypothetical protein N0V89_002053 [Didymosphaeria variabile]